ncbi:MAG: hypothetical protein GY867_08665 [bacterium]|nr:hypothetical protein [bacterium]
MGSVMKNRFVNKGVIIGGVAGGLALGWFKHSAIGAELPLGWQLAILTAFGALVGLVIGLVYRWRDSR